MAAMESDIPKLMKEQIVAFQWLLNSLGPYVMKGDVVTSLGELARTMLGPRGWKITIDLLSDPMGAGYSNKLGDLWLERVGQV